MNYLESSVLVTSGEFPYISFGSGKKNLVIIIGMNMTGLKGLGEAVTKIYHDYIDEYTVYVFDRLNILKEDASIIDLAHDTAEAMHVLKIEKADVIGVSQGGMIGLYLAIDYPIFVYTLICCSSCSYQNEVGKETFSLWARLAEQNGKEKANYGDYIIKNFSKELTREYGKGFSSTNLKMMRRLY